MKSAFFHIVLVVLICQGCSKENDLQLIADQNGLAAQPSFYTPTGGSEFISQDNSLSRSGCVNLNTSIWLAGTARLQSPHYSGDQKLKTRIQPGGRDMNTVFIINAQGAGWSDSLARCLTQLVVSYNPDRQIITGTLNSVFPNEEVLEQHFQGNAQTIQVISGDLILALDNAWLDNGRETYYLQDGQITLTLPSNLTGVFEINIETSGTYCVQ